MTVTNERKEVLFKYLVEGIDAANIVHNPVKIVTPQQLHNNVLLKRYYERGTSELLYSDDIHFRSIACKKKKKTETDEKLFAKIVSAYIKCLKDAIPTGVELYLVKEVQYLMILSPDSKFYLSTILVALD